MWRYGHIINGELVFSEKTASVFNPATGSHLADVPVLSSHQLDEAVAAAELAFPAWANKTYEQRGDVLLDMAGIIETHANHYKELLTSEQGKPYREATFEIMGAAHVLRETARFRLPETVHEDSPERKVITQHVPLGVTAAIVPWNFPVLLAVWKIAPALLAGNTILVKPSPWTPLTTLHIIADLQRVLPPGVLSVVNGDEDLGPLITAHLRIKKARSIQTGKNIMRSASHNLKRITLELGGNDPMIILPSVDPKIIAPSIFWGAFTNNGQFCIAAKRIYIHDSVYEPIRDALVAYARTIIVGDGAQERTQIGPVQNQKVFDKLREIFEDTKARGCRFALGGDFPPTNLNQTGDETKPPGLFIPITIVDNPPEDSRVVQEEQFGPIVPLLRWWNEADVVHRANATSFGLGASVWGSDLVQATRIASQMESGSNPFFPVATRVYLRPYLDVWVNEIHRFGPTIPGGGHKQFGIGVENGVEGLKEWTNYQTISINKCGITAVQA
ncbi:NAD-dependent succinate aldehyde dehydrogenase [Rhizoctonia solani]|nr:NAD-dependent succinate aldehyde dehydrogenase [Rhizoctonia solani]